MDNKKERVWLWFMNLFKNSCHQRAERSFFYHGYQFPCCARCTGLWIGYTVGIVYAICYVSYPLWISLCMMLPMMIDGTMQYYHLWTSTNIRRFITGLLFGVGIINIIKLSLLFLL